VELVPLQFELPPPVFRGTPVPLKEPRVERPREAPRAPFMAPPGIVNLAQGKATRCSDSQPQGGEIDYVNDGRKEAAEFNLLTMGPGPQWVQIDLGKVAAVYAILLWHNHAEARVYRDVIVQISGDPDFLDPVTVFNNDYDNSSGMGIGTDLGYVETSEGKLIDCQGQHGRYVRCYSNGNHLDANNHYTEVEIYGHPVR
jgi:hypothetical protein